MLESRYSRWESFAKEDPYWYVDMAHDGDLNRFWQKGREVSESLLERVSPFLYKYDTVIEIGCGVGRLIIPMSEHFNHAVGVDVAPKMLELLKTHAREFNVEISAFQPEDSWDQRPADLIYSKIVFRHIQEYSVIDQYIRMIGTTLKLNGAAVLEFDTRPVTLLYRLRNHLPDFALPRSWRRGARGIRRSSSRLESSFRQHGLTVAQEHGRHTGAHEYILLRE